MSFVALAAWQVPCARSPPRAPGPTSRRRELEMWDFTTADPPPHAPSTSGRPLCRAGELRRLRGAEVRFGWTFQAQEDAMAQVKPIPQGMHTLTPNLVLHECAKAIEFYKRALGAKEISRMPAPN